MYMCQMKGCKYRTARLTNLKRHVAIHKKHYHGVFKCSLCTYRSNKRQNVSRHLSSIHAGEGVVEKKANSEPQFEEAAEPLERVVVERLDEEAEVDEGVVEEFPEFVEEKQEAAKERPIFPKFVRIERVENCDAWQNIALKNYVFIKKYDVRQEGTTYK